MFEVNKKTLRNLFLVVAGGIVLYWILHDTERVGKTLSVVKDIFSPFLMGACVAFILNVPMRAFEGLLKKIQNPRWRRVLAVLMTVLAVLLIFAVVFWLLIPQLIKTVESLVPALEGFAKEVESYISNLLQSNPRLLNLIVNNTDFENLDLASVIMQGVAWIGTNVSSILSGAVVAISSIFDAIVDFVIALVFALYFLFQKETLARQGRKLLYAFCPERIADHVVRILRLSNSTFSNFLSGQCVEVCILGAMFAVTMAIFKMPYIPLISVLIAVTAFIPIVGAFVGCIVGAFLIFVSNPLQALIFVAMFLILQQIENNLIYPRVVGDSIGLSGMWVLLAIAVGGELFGVAGMFLMIPLASVLYTLLREITNNKLKTMTIDPEKLKEQPPELRSHFKEKRETNKAKMQKRKEDRKAKKANKQ